MSLRAILVITIAYVLACAALFEPSLRLDTFSSDASDYHRAGIQLAERGFYSLDGEVPYAEREPGMSFVLALLYKIFGNGNRIALFVFQIGFHFIASLAFVSSVAGSLPAAVQKRCLLFLLLLPSILHILFLALRESVTLSLMLLAAAFFERWREETTWRFAAGLALLWSAVALTYLPFLFFPICLAVLALARRLPFPQVVFVAVLPLVAASAWGYRNAHHTGTWELTSNWRSTAILYARAEQAEFVRGWEPLRCLYAEYVTRNWDGRSDSCSLNAVINRKWPGRHPTPNDDRIRAESLERIRGDWPNYLWFSLSEVLEFHLPFVAARGIVFNFLTALALGTVYVGCVFALFSGWRVPYDYCLLLVFYSVAVFAAFDATPRYHMPIIFCYVLPASVGYSVLAGRLHKWLS